MTHASMREAYGQALKELGTVNNSLVVLESDVGASSRSVIFGEAFPDRYFNVGIAELNMVTMAAGMATCGLIPFANALAAFLGPRSGDSIQNLIAMDNLNVKLVGSYCGMSDSLNGAGHQCLTDIAQMRAIPNMTVVSACDTIEVKKAVFAAAATNGPVYLRLSRMDSEVIFDEQYNFRIGKGVVLAEGDDLAIISTGTMTQKALRAATLLREEGIAARVVHMHTVKPLDVDLLCKCARETGAILTVEEHNVCGGLGSAVCEVLAQRMPVPVSLVGVEDVFGESGEYEELLEKHGLCPQNIAQKAHDLTDRK